MTTRTVPARKPLLRDRHGLAYGFHDDDQTYVYVRLDGCAETYAARSRHGRAWLQRLFIVTTQKCPSSQALADAWNTLEADALRRPARAVHVRIAASDDAIYIDLANPRLTFVVLRRPFIALAWWATVAVMWGVHFWCRSRARCLGCDMGNGSPVLSNAARYKILLAGARVR